MKKIKSKIWCKVKPNTIYTDIVDLPDELSLGLTVHYYNDSGQTLYIELKLQGNTNWNNGSEVTVQLGSLASGNNAYYNWDNALTRDKPASETTETLTLSVVGYTDAGYTSELGRFSRSVTIIIIDSNDGSWTEDELDNFDDGTVQGWNVVEEQDTYGSYAIAQSAETDQVLSSSYSLRTRHGGTQYTPSTVTYQRFRAEKSITTPNKTYVYGILNIRLGKYYMNKPNYLKYLQITTDSDTLIHLGKGSDGVQSNYIPLNKWIRIMVPLTANSTFTIKIILQWITYGTGYAAQSETVYAQFWLDDFRVISKD